MKAHYRLNQTAYAIAQDLHQAGAINEATMHEFDAACLPQVKDLTANQIKKIRTRQKVSQEVFAKLLNISIRTVQAWEQGEQQPRGMALKLLNLVAQKGLGVLV